MKLKALSLFLLVMVLTCFGLFRSFQHNMTQLLFEFGTGPEFQTALNQAGRDLKRLAELDPGNGGDYRVRFDRIQELRKTVTVLQHSREQIAARFEAVLLALFFGIAALSMAYHWLTHRHANQRLRRLQLPLQELASGESAPSGPLPRGGLIGRMAGMIEETSRVFAKQKNRLRYLENLERWQETARRQAHELKKPLTAARLELERLASLLPQREPDHKATACLQSVLEEMDRVNRVFRATTGFARIGKPRLEPLALDEYLEKFATRFRDAWPNLTLALADPLPEPILFFDPFMTRQVLMNLCENAALALSEGNRGVVRISIEVTESEVFVEAADNGPGIPSLILPKLFEPYASTRRTGMGLGLAISRKIMLEQGGDLELVRTDAEGAAFRLVFPLETKKEK